MRKTAEVDGAVRAGLEYIASQQSPNGGFESFSSPSSLPFVPEITYKTTFTPSLILAALAGTDVSPADDICRRTADYLRRQASPQWSYNYWVKRTRERQAQPYPDDLDDTFCALAALYLYDPSMIDAGVLAKATKLLLATESSVGGPYRTWLVSTDSQPVWLDVDVAVNANVAYFLTLLGSPLPKLTSFLDDAILADKLNSPYYPSALMPVYYMARGYNGLQKDKLVKILRKLLSKSETTLETALCLSSLLRLDPTSKVEDEVTALLETQAADGAWTAAAFCLDPAVNGQTYYNGTPALTTAFALEALWLYSQAGQAPSAQLKHKTDQTETLQTPILNLAKKQCQNLGPELRTAVLGSLEMIAKSKNGPEITGLAGNFHQSLAKPPRHLKKDFIVTLGLANLYGWLAYTIYDDFLDEEGKPGLVPVANAAMRRSLDNYFAACPSDHDFQRFVRQTFDTIDGANAWELANCRFEVRGKLLAVAELPDYGGLAKLAERSIGHALSPLAVLTAADQGPDTAPAQNLLKAFRHYLIARQLNDDAHDWPEDLQKGHITPVAAQILRELKVGPGNHDLNNLLSAARPQFWNFTLPGICQLMRRHIRLSRQALKRSAVLRPDNVITDLLDGIEVSVTETLRQQGQAKDFLRQYGRSSKKGANA